MFDPTEFLPNAHDPFEELDLRWRRCEYLLAHRRLPSPPRDDACTHDAWQFLRALRRCRNDTAREQLAQRHPAINAAYLLYTQAGSWKRAELEARLLARESDDTIAKKCHLTPAVVAAYHNLFFAVRPHLDAEIYIVTTAIGPKAYDRLTSSDNEVLLKLFGYRMGGLMVDKLLDYFAQPPQCPADLTPLDDESLAKLQGNLQLRAMILTLTIPANPATAVRLPAIRKMLAQAGLLGKAATNHEISPLSAVDATLDFHALLPEPQGRAASDSPLPAGQGRAVASIQAGASACPDQSPAAPRRSRQKAIPA